MVAFAREAEGRVADDGAVIAGVAVGEEGEEVRAVFGLGSGSDSWDWGAGGLLGLGDLDWRGVGRGARHVLQVKVGWETLRILTSQKTRCRRGRWSEELW